MKNIIITSFLLSFSLHTFAQAKEARILAVDKSYHPENTMIVHTQVDKDCKFVPSTKNAESNYAEFYWRMNNGAKTKEIHKMIRSEIKNRFKFDGINSSRDSFRIRIGDLKELKHDLEDPTLEVVSEKFHGQCHVKSILTLGPSGQNKKIYLKRNYCEVTKNFLGLPNGCSYVTFEGIETDTGNPMTIRFNKK